MTTNYFLGLKKYEDQFESAEEIFVFLIREKIMHELFRCLDMLAIVHVTLSCTSGSFLVSVFICFCFDKYTGG